jgi:hypothetical protein
MKLISHRRNTIADLIATPVEYGVEVDIRSFGDRLIIHHDPFVDGEEFTTWLDYYHHGTLILNVKEEGLEQRLLKLMSDYKIEDFFFLDQSFPFLIKTSRGGERRCAVRVSEYEHIDTAMSLAGRLDWVWVDCFTHFPLSSQAAERLRKAGFKLCLVSPELQQRTDQGEIPALRRLLAERGIAPEAVCTKWPERWTE